MIIDPVPPDAMVDDSGQTWVSAQWLRQQTVTDSTEGWNALVVERIKAMNGGRYKLHSGKVWWKLNDVLKAFKKIGEASD